MGERSASLEWFQTLEWNTELWEAHYQKGAGKWEGAEGLEGFLLKRDQVSCVCGASKQVMEAELH